MSLSSKINQFMAQHSSAQISEGLKKRDEEYRASLTPEQRQEYDDWQDQIRRDHEAYAKYNSIWNAQQD